MTTDILEVNDFIVLIDKTDAKEAEVNKCQFDHETIGISFYASGNVEIEACYGEAKQTLSSQKGMALAFAGNSGVAFAHKISQQQPLNSVSVFTTIEKLDRLPQHEKALYSQHFGQLLTSKSHFEIGPRVLMTPEMQSAISKIFETNLKGSARSLFLKSQVLELLSHFFGQLEAGAEAKFNKEEVDKIHQAGEIMVNQMDKPPSLTELSKMVGINSNKLKSHFKQIFGVPVYKYLQNQRLQKAYQLLQAREMTVQEVAWFVGYESMGSFSNAFRKQYGFRPSEVIR